MRYCYITGCTKFVFAIYDLQKL